jgi:hypothetical protein
MRGVHNTGHNPSQRIGIDGAKLVKLYACFFGSESNWPKIARRLATAG